VRPSETCAKSSKKIRVNKGKKRERGNEREERKTEQGIKEEGKNDRDNEKE
jgi:hypothetical protein